MSCVRITGARNARRVFLPLSSLHPSKIIAMRACSFMLCVSRAFASALPRRAPPLEGDCRDGRRRVWISFHHGSLHIASLCVSRS